MAWEEERERESPLPDGRTTTTLQNEEGELVQAGTFLPPLLQSHCAFSDSLTESTSTFPHVVVDGVDDADVDVVAAVCVCA